MITGVRFPLLDFLCRRAKKRKPHYTDAHMGWVRALLLHFGGSDFDISNVLEDPVAYPVSAGVFVIHIERETDIERVAIDFEDEPRIAHVKLLERVDRYLKFHLTADALSEVPMHLAPRVGVIGPCMGQTFDEQVWYLLNRESLRRLPRFLGRTSLLEVNRFICNDASARWGYCAHVRNLASEAGWDVETSVQAFMQHMHRHRRFNAVLDAIGERPFTPARKVLQALDMGVPVISNGLYQGSALLPFGAGDVARCWWPIAGTGVLYAANTEGIKEQLRTLEKPDYVCEVGMAAMSFYDMHFDPARIYRIITGEQ